MTLAQLVKRYTIKELFEKQMGKYRLNYEDFTSFCEVYKRLDEYTGKIAPRKGKIEISTKTVDGHDIPYARINRLQKIEELSLEMPEKYLGYEIDFSENTFSGEECLSLIILSMISLFASDELLPAYLYIYQLMQDEFDSLEICNNKLTRYNGRNPIVHIPEGVTEIADKAFLFSDVQEVTFPSTLKKIGHFAFFGCTELESLDLPHSVEFLGNHAFGNCFYLERIDGAEGLTRVGAAPFSRTPWFEKSLNNTPDGLVTLGKILLGISSVKDGLLEIPEGICFVADSAASGIYNDVPRISELSCSRSLEKIDRKAFYSQDLKIVDLGGTREIDEQAFGGCKNLITFHADKKSIQIDPSSFANSPLAEKILKDQRFISSEPTVELSAGESLPNDLETTLFLTRETIATWDRTRKDPSIEQIIFEDEMSVYDAEEAGLLDGLFPCVSAYYIQNDNARFRTVDGVLYCEKGLLLFPPAKEGIFSIPEGVRRIYQHAFRHAKISKVIFPSSLKVIDESSFLQCDHLEEIFLPSTIDFIGDLGDESPFEGCKKISKIEVAAENKDYFSFCGMLYDAYGQLLTYPSGSTNQIVELPNGCTQIASFAFSECQALVSLTLPETVEQISDFGLDHCNLRDLHIINPRTVVSDLSFCECDYLQAHFPKK